MLTGSALANQLVSARCGLAPISNDVRHHGSAKFSISLIAVIGRKLFAARPMPELLSPVWELQFAATGNRPAFLRDEPFVIFPKG
jgi:hypothetical protein